MINVVTQTISIVSSSSGDESDFPDFDLSVFATDDWDELTFIANLTCHYLRAKAGRVPAHSGYRGLFEPIVLAEQPPNTLNVTF